MGLIIEDPNGDNQSPDSPYRRLGDTSPGWSHVTDATPHSPEDSSGGTGQVAFSASQRDGESDLLIARDIIADGDLGKINSLSLQNGRVSVTTDTILSRLDVERTALPWPQDLDAGWEELPRGLVVNYAGTPHTLGEVVLSVLDSARDENYVYVYVESVDSGGAKWFVLRYNSTGVFVDIWPQDGGTAPAGVSAGGAIEVNGANVYLTNPRNSGGNYVKKYTLTGTFVSEFRPGFGSGNIILGGSIALDGSANIYVTGTVSGSMVQKFTNAGTLVVAIGTPGSAGTGTFGAEPTLIFDGLGIATLDRPNRRVRTYTTSLVYVDDLATWPTVGNREPLDIRYNDAGIIYVLSGGTSSGGLLHSYESYALLRTTEVGAFTSFSPDSAGRIWTFTNYFDGAVMHSLRGLTFLANGPTPLSVYIHYYLSLCLEIGQFEYEFSATEVDDLLFPGWTDNVWEKLKQLAPVKRVMFEASRQQLPLGGYRARITVRDIDDGSDAIEFDQSSDGTPALSLSANNVTRNYSIIAQQPSHAPLSQNIVVFSLNRAGANLSVAEFNTATTEVRIPHSLVSVQSPPEHDPLAFEWNDGVPGYMIYDSDNVLLPVGLFSQYGGNVEATLGADGTILIKVTGPAGLIPGHSGPFSFSDILGDAHLSIGGAGIIVEPRELSMYTGADPVLVTRENGPRIDIPFIDTVEQAYDAGSWATFELSGPRITMGFTTGPGGYIDNNGTPALITPGMRISYNYQNWRVMTVNASASGSSVTLQPYTTVGEVDALWAGQTVGDYDTFWDGYRTYDAKMRPLWQ